MRRALPNLLFALIIAAAAVPHAQQPSFRHERPVLTDAAGPHRLAVDLALLMGAGKFTERQPVDTRDGRRWRAHGGLADLRLFDAAGVEVPHLLIYPPAAPEQFVNASVLPIAATEKTSGLEADLGVAQNVDMVQVEGLPAPFLKRLVLEGSADREHWTLLQGEGTLFDLPQERLRQRALPFRPGLYRFLRVTWNDTNSGRVPLPRAVFARRAESAAPAPPPLTAEAVVERRPSEPGRSRFRVRLPAAGLPVVALTLDVGGSHVFRTAVVMESTLLNARAVPTEIGRATLSRVVREGVTAEDLRIPIAASRAPSVDLIVDDGSNPPLAINRVVLEFAELPWIYFETAGGPLTAKYGSPALASPRYDLEAMRESVRIGDLPEARWGDPQPLTSPPATQPAPRMPTAGAAIDIGAFRYRRALPDGPAGLVTLPLDAAVLAHSRGPVNYFGDVRVVDDRGYQVPYLLERLEEPLPVDLVLKRASPVARELHTEPGHHRTTYVVELPYAALPPARLALETSAAVFSRVVRVGLERAADRNHRDPWFEPLATSTWTHADDGLPAPGLLLNIPRTQERTLVISIDEGDNSPLPIRSARLLLPSYRLRFFHPGRPLQLVYSRDDKSSPTYDLTLLATELMAAEATEITVAPEGPEQSRDVRSLVSPRVFWAGLIVAVLVLVGLVMKLVRQA